MTKIGTNDKTTINVKIPKSVKAKLDDFTSAVGIPLSTMINSYLLELSETRRFTVEQSMDVDEVTARDLRKSLKEIKEGKYYSMSFEEFEKKIKSGKL